MIFVWLQRHLPQKLLSRLAGWLAEKRLGWLTRVFIWLFVRYYRVDMQEASESNLNRYATFNEFFTRSLNLDLRPIAQLVSAVVSPVDGFISQIGHLNNDVLLQAKGRTYSLTELLAGDESVSHFKQGIFLTAYLAPKNYHRIHMPVGGKLTKMLYVPGKLFSVKPRSLSTVDRLFARNERVICLFDTNVGPMGLVLVGAFLVGQIVTKWAGPVSSMTKSIASWSYNKAIFEKGEEIAHFKMGSAVILLFQKHMSWMPQCQPGAALRLGEMIADSN